MEFNKSNRNETKRSSKKTDAKADEQLHLSHFFLFTWWALLNQNWNCKKNNKCELKVSKRIEFLVFFLMFIVFFLSFSKINCSIRLKSVLMLVSLYLSGIFMFTVDDIKSKFLSNSFRWFDPKPLYQKKAETRGSKWTLTNKT